MKRSYSVFQPTDKSNFFAMLKSELLQWKLNRTPIWNIFLRNLLAKKLFASIDGSPYCIQVPFHIFYGKNTYVGKNFFANYNCTIMDHAKITIGDNVMLAPNVTITTINHPIHGKERRVRIIDNSFEPKKRGNWELVSPIKIGNDVWIATGVTICPGVTIGDNVVIGAGSVVLSDIPSNSFACGVPCKVIREITEADIINNKYRK